MIAAAETAGLEVRTPLDHRRRGGTVTVWHPRAEATCPLLIEREILCDFRPGAGIRLAPHFYTTEEECDRAIRVLAELAGHTG